MARKRDDLVPPREITILAPKPAINAKTAFGKKLLAIRNRAIQNGMALLSNDEILAEVAAGRNEAL